MLMFFPRTSVDVSKHTVTVCVGLTCTGRGSGPGGSGSTAGPAAAGVSRTDSGNWRRGGASERSRWASPPARSSRGANRSSSLSPPVRSRSLCPATAHRRTQTLVREQAAILFHFIRAHQLKQINKTVNVCHVHSRKCQFEELLFEWVNMWQLGE